MAANRSVNGVMDGVSISNTTDSGSQTFYDKLGGVPTVLLQNIDLLILEIRIVSTALAIIYIGCHAALRRPPSAAAPQKRGRDKKGSDDDEDRDDAFVQGMLPSDIILIPILAGIVLIGLYYLINWLEDPDILNKILKVYFSVMSLASLGKLLADGLHVLTTFVFPTVWTTSNGRVYHIDGKKQQQWYSHEGSTGTVQLRDDGKRSPLPGRLSSLQLSARMNTLLWGFRHLLTEEWTVRFAIHGIMNEKVKASFNDILGIVLAVGANVVYHTLPSNFISNLMGYAFSYFGIIVMSPTTFGIGSGVLFGLFFYDIVMVFYTPYMVTVATKIDAPIKLVFEGPTRASMLGLGDIVVPGMFIALCLRFDLYMYYHRQRKLQPVELSSSNENSTKAETRRMIIKPDYVNPQGQWGDRFWGTSLLNIFSPDATPRLKASAFPKPYFYAAMFGYLIAMVVTLVMLLAFKHAQPALLYLVPGVVAAVWVTGAIRGEVKDMWVYTEDGSLDMKDVLVEVDRDGRVVKTIEPEKKENDGEGNKNEAAEDKKGRPAEKSTGTAADEVAGDKHTVKPKSYPVFLLSIEAPIPGKETKV
ncbi:signal peptide peptidase-domain-containing protein [Xylariaceae sp. FL1019]|nr:signal peptide peptidase-domain-containing protein [Xylariaceae sp. FL1019]